jgi:hypothetical protein
MLEAQLVYRSLGGPGPVSIGTTVDSHVLVLLRDRLLEDAWAEAHRWAHGDPGIFALRMAEAERLGRVLAILLPDQKPPRSGLRAVKPKPDQDGP